MNEKVLSQLYQNGLEVFDLPDYETFKVDMQDESKLSQFRESMVSENFDIPDIETFKTDIGFLNINQDPVKEPVKEEKLEITEQDWTDTEENFLKKNKEKLAKLYPNFEFEESTFDINGITAKNKSTGEEESFDLAGTSFQFSDFNEFKEFVSKKPETDPAKQEVYSKTGLMVNYDDYGDTSTNNLYDQVEIVEEEGKSAPFLPEELGVTYGGKSRSPEANEMLTIVNSIEGIAIDAATNLKKVFPGIRTENESLSGDFNKLNDKEQKQFETYVYNQVKQQTGINITEDSFYAIYGDDENSKMRSLIGQKSHDIAEPMIYETSINFLGRAEASKEYKKRKYNNLENNLTKEQLDLRDLNGQVEAITEQIEDLELKKGRSSQDNDRIIKLKEQKQALVDKQNNLGGGVWDATGNWVNTLNISDKKKEELKQIEANAANMGTALNMFASEGTDLEKLSARDLSRNLLNNKILETEYLDSKGRKDKIKVNLKDLLIEEASEIVKVKNYLNAKGFNISTVTDQFAIGGVRLVDTETLKDIEEIDLTYNDLYNLGVRTEEAGGYKGGLDNVLARKKGEDILNYRIWEEEKLETEAEIRGLYKLVELGEDPALIKKPTDGKTYKLPIPTKFGTLEVPLTGVAANVVGFIETGGRATGEAALMQWGGYNQEEVKKVLGESSRNKLDEIQKVVSIVNNSKSVQTGKAEPIKLSPEQKENFEMGLSEMTANATGGFIPTLLEFALFEAATGGMGTPAAIARLPKFWRTVAMAGKEEVKMQATTADFGLGTGAMFFGLGKVFEPIKFFKKHRVGLNTLMDKYAKAGPAGAMSIEGSEIIHAVVDDMLDNGDFRTAMDSLYGDTDEATKRFISNVMMFKLTGVQHLKLRDFQSNSSLGREMNKLSNRSSELAKQGERLLQDNNINTIPKEKLTKDGEKIPTTTGDKEKKIQEELVNLSKQNTPEGKQAKVIIDKISKVKETINTVDQMMSVRTQYQSLNPFATDPFTGEKIKNEKGEFELNPDFEKNFNNQITNPIFKAIGEAAKKNKNGESTFVNPEVVFLKAEDAASQMGKGNTAEFIPGENKILIDLSKYTPGKPLHELSHVVFNAYFKNNPEAKTIFTNKMREMFKGVDFGAFKDTELRRGIQEEYKDKNIQGEEYIAFLTEFLSDPKMYYQNKYLAGSLVKELKSEFRLIRKKYGLGNFGEPKTAEDLVKMLGDLGKEYQRGYVSDVSASQFAALGKVDLSDVEYYPANIDANYKKAKTMASKEGLDIKASSIERAAENDKVVKEIKTNQAREELPTAYEAKTDADVFNLYWNNTPLVENVLKTWETKSDFNFKSSTDRDAMKEALDKKLYRYAELYGETKNMKQKAGETAEQFTERKRQVENLEVPFGAYAIDNLRLQIGNAIVESKLGFREGNKIIFKDVISGERAEIAMETMKMEDAVGGVERVEFEEGKTDAEGKALIEPITIIEPTKQKFTEENISTRLDKLPESYKETPDLSNVASEFGVKESKVNDNNGQVKKGSTRLSGKEVVSSQEFIRDNSKMLYDLLPDGLAGEGAREGIRGTSTGVQTVLLNEFYTKGERAKTGPGLIEQTKKPFNKEKFEEYFGISSDKLQTLKENGKIDQRVKALIHQTGKAITNRTIRKKDGLTVNEKENLSSGKSPAMASKPIFIESIERIKNITQEQRLKALAYLRDEGKDVVDLNDISEIIRKTGMSEKGIQEVLSSFEKIINDPTNNKEIKRLIEERDVKDFDAYTKDLSEATGLTIEDAKIFAEKELGDYKKLYKELKVEYQGASPKEGFKTVAITDKNIKEYQNTIKEIFKDLDLDMLEAGNSTVFSYIINSLNSKSMLKFRDYTGHGGKFKNGDTMTKKTFGVESNPEFIRKILEDPNFGKVDNKEKTEKYLQKTKYAFQPSWGSGAGNKGKSEVFAKLYDKNPESWLTEQQKIYSSQQALKDFSTTQEAIDATYKANKYAYKEFFKSILNLKNSESLFLGQLQTSASSGLPRGLVPMMSVTTKPKQKEGKSTDLTHNEHALEMFNIMKRFHEIKNSKTSIENKEALIDIMVDGVAQHLIPKELQGLKDSKEYKGSKGRVSENDLLNTFVKENSGKDQVFIAGEYAGMTVSEMMIKKYGAEAVKKMLKDIPYEKLSSEGVKSKQAAEYYKEKNRVIKDNAKEVDATGVVYASKDITLEEVLGKAKSIDQSLKLAREKDKPVKKIRVFDFDDTIAKSNNIVIAKKDGKEIKLNAEDFAKKGLELKDKGWEMDFSDFNKVTDGSRGPLFNVAEKIKEARGNEDLFILTARAPESREAIYEFLKAEGLEFKKENIIGLGNSTGEAKANWLVDKAAEGYNDFYFADDAPQNVKAAKESMSLLDVKSKTQLVRASKDLKIESEKDKKKLNWKTDEAGNIKTTFQVAGKKYNFNLDARDSKGSFDVEFNLGGRIDITGTGNAVKVIRTVYNGLLDVVSKNPKIKRLEFSSLKSEQSRVKLYTTLMDRVAKKLGWKTDIWESNNFITPEKSSYDFEITKPRKKQVVPVEKVLNVIDVKSETQQKLASKDLNMDFNKLLEESTGVEYFKEYSAAKARTIGASKGKFKFFIPHSAEDFTGLIYSTLAKGKKGDKQMAWYKENLLNPYSRAMDNLSRDRVQLLTDFKELKKQLNVPKDLRKEAKTGFTNEQAVRVYLFEKAGYETPGLSKTDKADLINSVESNGVLKAFADQIFSVTKGDGYAKPGESWLAGTITTDLIDLINTGKRSKYLEEWQANVDQIYSKENLNKLEAIYGTKYRESLENILARMKAGKNRLTGGNRLSNQMLDYVNGSNAAIMFFNVRSAALQMISNINYVNWSFNNPLKAGAAVANQPQYWKDVVKLLNSDYLMDRRNGLKLNINESEIADAASTSKNKFKAGIQYILQKGYLPTQYADSFAIATGGATFYRNRIKDLIKNEGKTITEAEKQALIEWRQISEESQQSSDPSRISAQQASDAGRLILMFANTPMQYARMQKRAFQDLKNGRGDAKSNISKIIYYGFVQNMIFNGLQNALFKIAADEDQTFDNNSKSINRTFNGMLDGILRGTGIGGASVSVAKNFLLDVYERSNRSRPEYVDAAWKLTQFSPPISSKISKIKQAAYAFDNKKMREEIYTKGFSLDNPAMMSGAKVVSATTNVPLDRLLQKYNNIDAALAEDTETWQSVAMMAGWPEWQIKAKPEAGPMTEEQKKEKKLNRYEEKYKAADGSTDFETLKKLNKDQQVKMLKDLGYGSQDIRRAKKESDRIDLIIEANKEQ
tara:strand:+ start:2265 stop:12074 length:9810 start_codon:yes stop_codon:yes gene_type:complete